MRALGRTLCAGALVCCFGGAARAEDQPARDESVAPVNESKGVTQEPGTPGTMPVTQLPEVVVEGRPESLVGAADTASEGTVGAQELQARPLQRPGEVLEAVPGVIVTQHSGAGKANQYFLRGFNLDHGTDFATSVDGVLVNLPTHAHGQGYTDLNFVIPELVQRLNYRKGVYYADLGDFSSAGGADMHYYTVLPQNLAQIEYGSFEYARGLFAASPQLGLGHLLTALELYHYNGPWSPPDDYRKINGVLRYSQGDPAQGFDVTAMAYAGKWTATDQIARRALTEIPDFGLYDSLDPSDGGDSQRYSLSAGWHHIDASAATNVVVYGFYYDLDLFSNFTYVLNSPQGDQIEQQDKRWVGGGQASRTWFGLLGNRSMENTVGLQVYSNWIENGLFQTMNRQRIDKKNYMDKPIPATTRSDHVWEATAAPYFENRVQWTDTLRSVFGLRVDYFHFDVNDQLAANSGTSDDAIASPKGSLVFGPWADTELYLSGGLGFHSNDARGVTTHLDASKGSPGTPVAPADPLVRTYGAEIGARTTRLQGLQSTLAFWWLDIGSELVFEGDAGTTQASAPSRRYGVESANYYAATDWLAFDADLAFSHSEFRETVMDTDTGLQGQHIPEAVTSVIAAGVTFRQPGERGVFGESRLRFFGARPLTVDNSVQSGSTVLLSAKLGYNFSAHWAIDVEGFNLLDNTDHEIDYYYPSRLPGEPAGPDNGGYNDIHFKVVDPISVRGAIIARFQRPVASSSRCSSLMLRTRSYRAIEMGSLNLMADQRHLLRVPLPHHPPRRTRAWALSVAAHMLALGVVLWLMQRTLLPPPPSLERMVFIEPAPPPPPPLGVPGGAPMAPAVPVPPQPLAAPPKQVVKPRRLVVPRKLPAPTPPAAPPQAAPSGDVEGSAGGVTGGVLGGEAGGKVGGVVGGHGDAPVPADRVEHPPVLLTRVLPVYPIAARARNLEGRVVLRAVVDRDGHVEEAITVIESVPLLDTSAVEALRCWRFEPGRDRDGRAVRVLVDVPIRFQLR